ncbi:hypothetical protein NMY22_g5961 [Coprinellus aureogranulatus]|nr:hypothetical protein NMY22_g5961 [Coprinellus aureogranulatus]
MEVTRLTHLPSSIPVGWCNPHHSLQETSGPYAAGAASRWWSLLHYPGRDKIWTDNTPNTCNRGDQSTGFQSRLISMLEIIVIPTLAQRLMINLRKADYAVSRSIASELLFAPPPPGLENSELQDHDNQDQFEMNTGNSHACSGSGDLTATGSSIHNA